MPLAGRRAACGQVAVLGREPLPPEPASRRRGAEGGAGLIPASVESHLHQECPAGRPAHWGALGPRSLEPEGEDGCRRREGHPLKGSTAYDVHPAPVRDQERRRDGETGLPGQRGSPSLRPRRRPQPRLLGLCHVSPVSCSRPTCRPQRVLPAQSSGRPRPALRRRELRCGREGPRATPRYRGD